MSDINTITGDTLDDILDYVIARFESVLGYKQIPWAIKEDDLPDIDSPVFYLSGTSQLDRSYSSSYHAECRDVIRLKVLNQIKNQEPVVARKKIIEECARMETEFIKNTESDNFTFLNFSKTIDIYHDNYFLVTVELEVSYERSL
jgi:hypothetical protein